MYNQILLTNILRILQEQNLTKKELAIKAGISVSFLSDLTHDKANPSLRIIEAIAEALDTPLPVLLDTTDLSIEDLKKLTEGKYQQSLPDGYQRLCAVLNEYQAFQVKQWDATNREIINRRNKPTKNKK